MSLIGHNLARAKQLNRSLVLQSLLLNGPLSRQNIAKMTKLTPATITNITAELLAHEWIEEIGNVEGDQVRSGRKSIALSINADKYMSLGVHLRSDRIELGIVNLAGDVKHVEMQPYETYTANTFVDYLGNVIVEYLKRNSQFPVSSVGIGSVGLVQHEQGIILSAEHMGWKNIEVAGPLAARVKMPVLLDNNVRTMALAEKMYGKNKLSADSLFVYIGRGIGAGLILGNQIYRGGITGAGEFGHITLDRGGVPCWCGNKGCLERYASEAALLKSLGFTHIDEIVHAIKAGDRRVEEAVIQAADMIAVGLASFNNIFHIQSVILAGAITDEQLPFVETIRHRVAEKSFLTQFEPVDVQSSALGKMVGVVGAASLSIYELILSEQDVQVWA
ncbi:ROK family transcriptional regulator [Paenibacillus thalictri]|uniref:ROK family transcriptional regulator n=1 Tax=Paenibacillus thalictri TaxID=2527873 RepID=A0A4Q9DG78_9BACL|nr:ROK family transcriptional regulator [Paenibacillus thalictri]TBL68474.1 ROK family transcriptional regulator [Paenibacillus thalictri]